MKAAMNLGLSDKLQVAFPDVVRVEIPIVAMPEAINPQWLAGFTSAEGCFFILISDSKSHSIGHRVRLVFQLTQHQRDKQLLICIKEYLACGNLYKNREAFQLMVTKFSDIEEKIIPFFNKFPIWGVKAEDFADFCRARELMKERKHLTAEGLEEIRQIKAGMNLGRKI